MGKVRVRIRCAKCYAVETHVIPAWSVLKTSCGCNGPYRVLERDKLPEDPAPSAKAPSASRAD